MFLNENPIRIKIQSTILQIKKILLIAFLTDRDKDMTQIISLHILVKNPADFRVCQYQER